VDFVNKQHARQQSRFAFFAPFGNLLVALIAHFGFDFSRVAWRLLDYCVDNKRTRKQGQKSLRTAVDDVNFMERDGMNSFLALLQLALGASDKTGLSVSTQSVKR
jgi:hypothetical protein